MSARINNYLKVYRRRWCLSQDELGDLLGIDAASTISRFESGERVPTRRELFACEVIFGVSPRALFPAYYQSIEEAVMRRAAALSAKLEGRTSAAAGVKRGLLETMVNRAGNASEA